MKRKTIIGAVVAVLIIFAGILLTGKMLMSFMFTSGFDISFENQTSSKISGLKITYMNAAKDVVVPDIEADSKIKLNINPLEKFGENSMKLYYFDQAGNRQEETIVGYFEMGYSGKSNVVIKSIDEAGILTFEVKER